jgi:hypothetical protein
MMDYWPCYELGKKRYKKKISGNVKISEKLFISINQKGDLLKRIK